MNIFNVVIQYKKFLHSPIRSCYLKSLYKKARLWCISPIRATFTELFLTVIAPIDLLNFAGSLTEFLQVVYYFISAESFTAVIHCLFHPWSRSSPILTTKITLGTRHYYSWTEHPSRLEHGLTENCSIVLGVLCTWRKDSLFGFSLMQRICFQH